MKQYGQLWYTIESDKIIIIGCVKNATDIVIPERIENKRVIGISFQAFASCTSLASVTIPNGVVSIGDWAFKNCTSLKNITIPDSAIYIGDATFNGCPSLERIEGRFNKLPPKVDFLNLLEQLNKRYCNKN